MILTGQRDLVAAWLVSKIRDMPSFNSKEFEAIGVVKDGELIGGVLYCHYSGLPDGTFDIHMSCAGEPGWLTKATLRAFFSYPFGQLGCSRVTTLAAKANKKARDLNKRLGFVHEGTIRGAFGENKHGILFGMLKKECRWIQEITL